MKLTLVGPRSVGKSTVGKVLSKILGIKYFEGDKLMHNALKKYGGLDKVIKSRKTHLIAERAFSLIKSILNNKKTILDLAGGAISSRKHKKISEQILKLIKRESKVIGLLPTKKMKESIEFLFKREAKRKHFKKTNKLDLKKEVRENYLKLKNKLKEHSDIVVYVNGKTPLQIAKEIIKRLEEVN